MDSKLISCNLRSVPEVISKGNKYKIKDVKISRLGIDWALPTVNGGYIDYNDLFIASLKRISKQHVSKKGK